MYKYIKETKKEIMFKMPTTEFYKETIDTIDKTISIAEFLKENDDIFIIQVFNKRLYQYDTIYSNVELKLNQSEHPRVDYYEIPEYKIG